uniref:Expressed protein n=1 Tax=Echinococcus granulosus TaxID=6210 RepID=A0A068X2R3_ECHGR|nr:expressed protein [Echinococcus granulosus]
MTRFNESRTLKHEMVTKEAIAAGAAHSFTYHFTRLTLQVMNIRIVTCVLLGIAILFTIIGVATNQWIGDNLLRNSSNYSVTANAVGYLLIVGAVLLCITLIIGIVQVRRSTESFCLCVAYFITLYLGVAALLVAAMVLLHLCGRLCVRASSGNPRAHVYPLHDEANYNPPDGSCDTLRTLQQQLRQRLLFCCYRFKCLVPFLYPTLTNSFSYLFISAFLPHRPSNGIVLLYHSACLLFML